MVTILFAHPWHGSFNKVILDKIVAKYESNKTQYQVIDLHKDGFDPVMHEKDLVLYSKGGSNDPLVLKYQSMIQKSDEVIVIFPIWWSGMPAILKGFFDKVLLLNVAFNYEGGWNPLLKVSKSTVITTSEQDTANYPALGDPIGDMIKTTLNSVGINNTTWLNCDHITSADNQHRIDFLDKVEAHV